MLAVVLESFGDGLHVRNLALRHPGAEEVRVRVVAASVNHVDIDIRNGLSRLTHQLPLILGREAAGEIDAVGARVSDLVVGDPVLVLPSQPCRRCAQCSDGNETLCT